MKQKSQPIQISGAGEKADERHRRAEALLNAKKTLELAEKLKFVSLNVAIESAKTRGGGFEIQRLKQELSDLTNQAVKASKEISELIATISGGAGEDEFHSELSGRERSHLDSSMVEFRRAVRLRKDLDELLAQCNDAIRRLDRVSPR